MTIKVTVPNTSSDSLTFGSANTPTAAQVIGIDSGSSNGQLAFNTTASGTSTERMRINASGNVGIGTSSPTAKLSIEKSSDAASPSRTPADYSIRLTAAATNTYNGGICVAESTYASAAITPIDTGSGGAQGWAFITGDSSAIAERARIDSSGNLLVGTTTASGKLAVAGAIGTAFIPSDGNGITWTRNGANYIVANGGGSASITVQSNTNGVVLNNAATAWASASDERLKDIIEPITDAANKVSTLRAVIGKYKTEEDGVRRSFLIAQDVQAVLPEAVAEVAKEDGGSYLSLAYTDTIPLLVAAIQEQQALITTLTERITALEAK